MLSQPGSIPPATASGSRLARAGLLWPAPREGSTWPDPLSPRHAANVASRLAWVGFLGIPARCQEGGRREASRSCLWQGLAETGRALHGSPPLLEPTRV